MDDQYFWTGWTINADGDETQSDTGGNDLNTYSVTEARDSDIFAFLLIPASERHRYDVRRDFDGRAYLYLDGADDHAFLVESELKCEGCHATVDGCECDL